MTERQSQRQQLHQTLRTCLVVIVGGLRREEKLRIVNERFGLEEVEWHEIDSDSPRATDSIVNRIRNGSVGAVVVLQGLMAHKVSKRIYDACHSCNVPYALADKGGTGTLEQAFSELERKLASV